MQWLKKEEAFDALYSFFGGGLKVFQNDLQLQLENVLEGKKTTFSKWMRKNYNCFELFMISLHIPHCNTILKHPNYYLYIFIPEDFFSSYIKLFSSVNYSTAIYRYRKSCYTLSWITLKKIEHSDQSNFTITFEHRKND